MESCNKAFLKATSIILKQDKYPKDKLLALYSFIYQTAIWQETSKIKATTKYIANGLGWTTSTVSKYKKALIELGLIEVVKKVDNRGRVEGWYIEIIYKPIDNSRANEKIEHITNKIAKPSQTPEKSQLHPDSFYTTSGQNPHVVKTETNALYKNINALTENINISHNHKSVSIEDTPPQKFENKNLSERNSNLKEKGNLNTKTEKITREKSCEQNQTEKSEKSKAKAKTMQKVRQAYEYKTDIKQALELWNFYMEEKLGYKLTLENLTTKELIYLKAICKKYTPEELEKYFKKLAQSEVLFNLKSGWRPDLAWALNYDNFKKVNRGQYIPKTNTSEKGYDPYPHIKDTTDDDLKERIKNLHPIFAEDDYLNRFCKSNEEKLEFIANSIPLLPKEIQKQTLEIIPEVKQYLKK